MFTSGWVNRLQASLWSFTKKGLLGVLFMLIILVTAAYSADKAKATEVRYVDRTIQTDSLSIKIEELKTEVVNTLKSCESAGAKETDALIVFDTNSKASVGNFQYQVKTPIYYSKKLYNKVITPKEAVLLALDERQAAELTKDIVFKTDAGLKNWLLCSQKNQLENKVNFIKELAK